MSSSLRDQLLKAGLVTEKQVKQADQQQRHSKKQTPRAAQPGPKTATEQAQTAKQARDRELNRQRQEQAELKARRAQIKQIIEQHALPRIDSDDCFNFVDRNKVRRVRVNAELRERLNRGDVAIVRCEGRYSLIPASVVPSIRERDERAIVPLQTETAKPADPAQDDPYKDFVVPDDLMW